MVFTGLPSAGKSGLASGVVMKAIPANLGGVQTQTVGDLLMEVQPLSWLLNDAGWATCQGRPEARLQSRQCVAWPRYPNPQAEMKDLYELGLRKLFIASGQAPDAFPTMSWITGIVGKFPPWSVDDPAEPPVPAVSVRE